MPVRSPVLVWFRRNLRLDDNRVLKTAFESGGPVIPIFILTPGKVRSASEGWLMRSLQELDQELLNRGSRLRIRSGDPGEVLGRLARETGVQRVFWDRSFEPLQKQVDQKVRARLTRSGIRCEEINDSLLFDPGTILTKQGTPFKVFTPFWNHCLSLKEPAAPAPCPARLPAPSKWPRSEELRVKIPKWAKKIEPFWKPGAEGARKALKRFLDGSIENYPKDRDRPFLEGTSRLSPHLHFGEISARQVWHAVREQSAKARRPGTARASEAFLRQLVWREFAHYLLFHFPETASEPLRKEFGRFEWKKDPKALRAWQKGLTGYPVVDAGMRELWNTGWMHNRVRMIAGSFLVKDLLQDWQRGAAWFMETLVDADLANNTFGWQWVAGCGADAAPYFRIFNPMLQGEKFDPEGAYVKRWVPELSGLPAKYIHTPWKAPAEVLKKAGVRLGKDYPFPVVDHDAARKRALFSYYRLKKSPSK